MLQAVTIPKNFTLQSSSWFCRTKGTNFAKVSSNRVVSGQRVIVRTEIPSWIQIETSGPKYVVVKYP